MCPIAPTLRAGLTCSSSGYCCVLINIDTETHPDLINSRFAYVSVSRARIDAQIYTNEVSSLRSNLSNNISKASAIEFAHKAPAQGIGQSTSTVGIEQSM